VGDDFKVAFCAVGGGVEEGGDEGFGGFGVFEDEEEVPAGVVEFGDLDLLGADDPADWFGLDQGFDVGGLDVFEEGGERLGFGEGNEVD